MGNRRSHWGLIQANRWFARKVSAAVFNMRHGYFGSTSFTTLLGHFWKAVHLTTELHPKQGFGRIDFKLRRRRRSNMATNQAGLGREPISGNACVVELALITTRTLLDQLVAVHFN